MRLRNFLSLTSARLGMSNSTICVKLAAAVFETLFTLVILSGVLCREGPMQVAGSGENPSQLHSSFAGQEAPASG
jgi:hypothetical protein